MEGCSMLRCSSDYVNVFMEAVVWFINKLTPDCVTKSTVRTFPNQKLWVDKNICDTLRTHTAAYNIGLATKNMEEHAEQLKKKKTQYERQLELQHSKGVPGDNGKDFSPWQTTNQNSHPLWT